MMRTVLMSLIVLINTGDHRDATMAMICFHSKANDVLPRVLQVTRRFIVMPNYAKRCNTSVLLMPLLSLSPSLSRMVRPLIFFMGGAMIGPE